MQNTPSSTPLATSIALVGPAHPLRGGIAVFNERLARQFQQQGHKVDLYSFSLQYPNFLFPGKTQYSTDPPPTDLHIETCINSISPLNWLKIGNKLAALNPDILLIRYWLPFLSPCLGSIARLVRRRNKQTRVVCLADNIVPHEHRPADRLLTRYLVNSCDGFVVMSSEVENDLRTFDRHKKSILSPHPIYDNFGDSLSRQQALELLQLPEDKQYLLFFGLIRRYKGLDLLLEALAQPELTAYPKLHLIVAGEFYDDELFYRQLIDDLNISDRVTFFPYYIPTAEVNRYFSAADVVVQPYRTATQSGITQMAYHFNKPMIVTHVGGLPEIVPHMRAGLIAAPSPQSIAQAIATFYNSTDLRQKLTQGVLAEKSRFSWEAMTDAIIAAAY